MRHIEKLKKIFAACDKECSADTNGQALDELVTLAENGELGGNMIVDSVLDKNSTNPIQNKVVAETFEELSTELEKKATKEYVAEQISNSVHLVKEIVENIPTVENAKENVLYMIKDTSSTGDDKYKEYQLINGEVVQTGDTSIDLSGYAKESYVDEKVTHAFDYLTEEQKLELKGDKGEQGIQGVQGEKGDKGATGATGASPLIHKDGTGGSKVTLATLAPKEGIFIICNWSSGGTLHTEKTDGSIYFNGQAMTGSKSITTGNSYTVVNSSTSTSSIIYLHGNGGARVTVIGDVL